MPSFLSQQETKPWRYFAHLLGHESEGSVFALLKSKGWAQALSAGTYSRTRDFEIFQVDISLTEKGLDKREEVLDVLFEYLRMLQGSPIERWVWDEMKVLEELRFRFLSKAHPINYTSDLAGSMQIHSPEHYLSGDYLLRRFDAQSIADFGAHLRPDNTMSAPRLHNALLTSCSIMAIAKSFDLECDRSETWYGAKFGVGKIPSERVQVQLFLLYPI